VLEFTNYEISLIKFSKIAYMLLKSI